LKVYVEPGATEVVSTKFKNLPEDEALPAFAGQLNYFRDETNGVSRLFVFRTVSKAATQMVQAEPKKGISHRQWFSSKLKNNPTNSIDQLQTACAKIISRDDRLGLYRFNSPMAVRRTSPVNHCLQPIGRRVDANYSVDRPAPVQLSQNGQAPAVRRQSESAGGQRPDCRLVIHRSIRQPNSRSTC